MTWQAGKSGNPKGRPPGTSHGRSALRESIQKEMPAVIKKLVDLAKSGDVAAARTLMERVLPPVRPESLPVLLPAVAAAQTATEQSALVIKAIATGELAPDVGAQLLGAMGQAAHVREIDELAAEVDEMKKHLGLKK